MKVRCSQLSRLMTASQKKGEYFGKTALSYIRELAKQAIYGSYETFSSKEVAKGKIVEPESLKLYNEVRFSNYTKNERQYSNNWLTGTPDVVAPTKILDLKSPWSLHTFPVRKDEIDGEYDWQMRGYMMLTDLPEAEVAFCLVDTPEELVGFDPPEIHQVSHINPELRVTSITYQRSSAHEKLIVEKVEAAREFYKKFIEDILNEHESI